MRSDEIEVLTIKQICQRINRSLRGTSIVTQPILKQVIAVMARDELLFDSVRRKVRAVELNEPIE